MVEPLQIRIAAHYEAASPATRAAGRAWYPAAMAAARKLACGTGTTRHRAAAVIAAHSPRTHWKTNLRRAAEHLAGSPRGMGSAIRRAERALGARQIPAALNPRGTAPKVEAFYRNIAGDRDAVTVDVWAARAAGISEREFNRRGGYVLVADAYRRAAALVGECPRDLQAIVWCHVRGRAT